MDRLPTVSIITPTFNSARTLGGALEALAAQDYPVAKLELVVADGGSSDESVELAEAMRARGWRVSVHPNPLRTGEAGKAVAARAAAGDVLAFIDSDNLLPDPGWLRRMVAPFADPKIVASEPLRYQWRAGDGYITRYCALVGVNDPLCLWLGTYDRLSELTGRWTECRVRVRDRGGWLEVAFGPGPLPTIGANGFMILRKELERVGSGDYLFDVDVLADIVAARPEARVAKVKTGIVHLFGSSVRTFYWKQRRRVDDYFFFRRRRMRTEGRKRVAVEPIVRFVAETWLVAPLVIQALRGYRRRPDAAWLFHPVAAWITLVAYGLGTIRGLVAPAISDRAKWRG